MWKENRKSSWSAPVPEGAGVAIGDEVLDGLLHAGLVGSGDDSRESRFLQHGGEYLDELNLRLDIKVAAFLTAVAAPVAGHGLVEGVEGPELDVKMTAEYM